MTARVPAIVEAALALPFARVGARRRGDRAARRRPPRAFPGHREPQATPLSAFFFDVLHADGADLLDSPGEERRRCSPGRPRALRVPRLVSTTPRRGAVRTEALASGHEGVVVKSLEAPYAAGRRGAGWIKVKPRAHARPGRPRRRVGSRPPPRLLTNLHLGARDPQTGGFVMLGKTFKGLTDKMLTWQTERLLELADDRGDGRRSAPSSSSRSPSTASSAAPAIRAAWRCASPASSATAPTSAPRRPTRSRPCWRCARAEVSLGTPCAPAAAHESLALTSAVSTTRGTSVMSRRPQTCCRRMWSGSPSAAGKSAAGPTAMQATLAGGSGGTWQLTAVSIDLLVGVPSTT